MKRGESETKHSSFLVTDFGKMNESADMFMGEIPQFPVKTLINEEVYDSGSERSTNSLVMQDKHITNRTGECDCLTGVYNSFHDGEGLCVNAPIEVRYPPMGMNHQHRLKHSVFKRDCLTGVHQTLTEDAKLNNKLKDALSICLDHIYHERDEQVQKTIHVPGKPEFPTCEKKRIKMRKRRRRNDKNLNMMGIKKQKYKLPSNKNERKEILRLLGTEIKVSSENTKENILDILLEETVTKEDREGNEIEENVNKINEKKEE